MTRACTSRSTPALGVASCPARVRVCMKETRRAHTDETRRHKDTKAQRKTATKIFYAVFLCAFVSLCLRVSSVWARSVSFIYIRTRAGQLATPRAGVLRDVQARVIIDPVDQPILENGIGSGDTVRKR